MATKYVIVLFCVLWQRGLLQDYKLEKVKQVSVQACLKGLTSSAGHYVLVPDATNKTLSWCLTVTTSKDKLPPKQFNVRSQESKMTFELWEQQQDEDARVARCRIVFDGYKGLYRLAPDLGFYNDECTQLYAEHRAYMTEQHRRFSSVFYNNKTRTMQQCPILELPGHNKDYQACTLSANKWYLLKVSSYLKTEFTNNTMSTIYYNDSQLISTHISTGMTSDVWNWRMIQTLLKSDECRATLHVIKDKTYKHRLEISGFYRGKKLASSFYDSRKLESEIMGKADSWLTFTIDIQPKTVYVDQEVCVNASGVFNNQSFLIVENRCIQINSLSCAAFSVRFCHIVMIALAAFSSFQN